MHSVEQTGGYLTNLCLPGTYRIWSRARRCAVGYRRKDSTNTPASLFIAATAQPSTVLTRTGNYLSKQD